MSALDFHANNAAPQPPRRYATNTQAARQHIVIDFYRVNPTIDGLMRPRRKEPGL